MKDIFIPHIRQGSNIYDGHVLVSEVVQGAPALWSYKRHYTIHGKTYDHGLLIRHDGEFKDDGYVVAEVAYPKQGETLEFELIACACERQGERVGRRRKRVQIPEHRENDLYLWLFKRSFNAGFCMVHVDIQAESVLVNRKGQLFNMNRTTYSGVLTITDESLFKTTLDKGLSTSRAFGFGLLTVNQ